MSALNEIEQIAEQLLSEGEGRTVYSVSASPAIGEKPGSVLGRVEVGDGEGTGSAAILITPRGGLRGEALARSAAGTYASRLVWSDTPEE